MSHSKLRVGILFGGKSIEHEISLISAKNVIEAMDKEKYEIVLIAIDKQGEWHLKQAAEFLAFAEDAKLVHLHGEKQTVALVPKQQRKELVSYSGNQLANSLALDVIFPILHGPMGEDGTMQGLLTLANIPFVGAGVLGSAIGMDKDVMKRLLRDAKIPIGKFITVLKHQKQQCDFETVAQEIGLPFFVKPANAGSSVGVSKVCCESDFKEALDCAFLYTRKVLLEEFIPGREIECSVLGNENPIASLPGEVIPQHEFYSYEAKYLDEQGALFQIPVPLPNELIEKVQRMSINAYQALCCEGMARIDFFLKDNGDLLVNEINTIPGFTKISMYPKNWEASGVSYSELIDRLISLAIERHAQESCLATSVTRSDGTKISEQV
ncbi:MAG: D-alanine--D-alanine ligase [Rhabdochlamydiaceae bacterium]|nr:D-alanine--D-alanine ligase [Rhabdochlamydiaceae bacterium]